MVIWKNKVTAEIALASPETYAVLHELVEKVNTLYASQERTDVALKAIGADVQALFCKGGV